MGLCPAARLEDAVGCLTHGSATITSGHDGVWINGQPSVGATDAIQCQAQEDPSTGTCSAAPTGKITTGSTTVLIHWFFAARAALSQIDHGGFVLLNTANVFIGGPEGKVAGPGVAALKACQNAAATRHTPGSPTQAYGNCATESWRQVVNMQRAQQGLPPLTEDQMAQLAVAHGGNPDISHPGSYAGLQAGMQEKILTDAGCPVEQVPFEDMPAALANGQAASITVDPSYYWPPGSTGSDPCCHEIMVTGVAMDANGNVVGYYVNDTSLGKCGMYLPAAVVNAALRCPHATVSKAQVWQ